MSTNTIAAISTGGGNSGINIIRISGPKSLECVKKIFTNSKRIGHQKIIYGKIFRQKDKSIIDEVLLSYFKSPNSFTGEDVCEINCHGGRQVTLDVLREVLTCGARLAEPGEFSKRAFLNGKMDLSKAEGIIDLINAKTSIQSKIAVSQLEGGLFNMIRRQKEDLIELLANIEVNIDYPEYDYDELDSDTILKKLGDVSIHIEKSIKEYNEGKYLKNGINVAILGGPNAGKSTLLNLLSKSNKAIVTDIEGTTRDVIEETVVLDNLVLNLSDTAGIRDTDDIIEKIGIERSIETIDKVDIVIYIVDASKGMSNKDEETIKLIKAKNKPIIICFNKNDLSRETDKKKTIINGDHLIYTSFLLNNGIEELKKAITEKLNIKDIDKTEDNIIVNERHNELLNYALQQLKQAMEEINKGSGVDIIEINIKEATNRLGEIIGENVSEDIMNKIFERFCLGK